jgi:hypothetical protein
MIASRLWRLVAVLQAALISSAGASVLPGLRPPDHPNALFARQQDPEQFNYALCRPQCERGSCGTGGSCPLGGGLLRRDVDASELFFNASRSPAEVHSIARRLFTWEAGSQDPTKASNRRQPKKKEADAYHVAVFQVGAGHEYYGFALPLADNVNERAISQQKSFGAEPFQIMTSGMHGCTAVIVVSTRGVWMTHLWESFSNGKDAEGNKKVDRGDPAFNQRVLMFLRGQTVTNPLPNGYPSAYVAPEGPGIDKSLFDNQDTDQTQVFIFTPVKYGTAKSNLNRDESLKYEHRYGPKGEVRDTILDILGPNARPRFIMVPYVPLNTGNAAEAAQLYTNSKGSVLFQSRTASCTKTCQHLRRHRALPPGTKSWDSFVVGPYRSPPLPSFECLLWLWHYYDGPT